MLLFKLLRFLPGTCFLLHLKFGLKLDPFCLDIDPGLAFVQNDVYLEGRSWASSCGWQNVGSRERKFVSWFSFGLLCFAFFLLLAVGRFLFCSSTTPRQTPQLFLYCELLFPTTTVIGFAILSSPEVSTRRLWEGFLVYFSTLYW